MKVVQVTRGRIMTENSRSHVTHHNVSTSFIMFLQKITPKITSFSVGFEVVE